MDIETLLRQHAEGFYDRVFDGYWESESVMTGYLVHVTDRPNEWGSRNRVQGACHAVVDRTLIKNEALAVITMADRRLATNQGAIQFYDWLINKSFFSDVFLCKDPVLSLRHGFVKRVDISAAKWLGAAQLARLSTSEFKKYMHSVYDVLASGFDIHPFLMMVLATELKLVSDGKVVKAGKIASQPFFSNNASHLPLVYFNTKEIITQLCQDNPAKPLWNDSYLPTFKQQRWPVQSNCVMSSATGISSQKNDPEVQAMLSSLSQGTPSLLFNLKKEVEEVPYTALWEEAIEELKSKIYSEILTNGYENWAPINLAGVEHFSKQYKLGE